MKKISNSCTVKKLYENTYSICDSGFGQGSVYMYLLVGNEKALLIDTGYGLLDLSAIVKELTDKEVICVCTHGHIDHAMGAFQFENAYMHSNDTEVYAYHKDADNIRNMCCTGFSFKLPKRITGNPDYRGYVEKLAATPHPPIKPLDDMGEFELGNRTVSWRLLPGHTPGSVVLTDEKYNTTFEGDAAGQGVWIHLRESSTLEEYIKTAKEYLDYLKERGVAGRYGGHTDAPLSVIHLEKLIACCELAMAKPKKGFKLNTVFGQARIVAAKGSAVFCGKIK